MSCLALHCNASGRILEVLCDQASLLGGWAGTGQSADAGDEAHTSSQSRRKAKSPTAGKRRSRSQSELQVKGQGQVQGQIQGKMLSSIVAPGGAQHLAHLLSLVDRNGAVCEWFLDLQSAGEPMSFCLWAAQKGEDLLLLGCADRGVGLDELAAIVPLAGEGHAQLAPLLQAIRGRAASAAALADDLREQARGLKQQVQPPPMVEHRLLGMAAHDLRNPLLVLSMGCSYVLHDASGLTEEQRSVLSESLDTCEFMNRLVEGMIELSRVAVGHLSLSREATDLADLVTRAVRRHERVAGERGYTVELVRTAPIVASVDPLRMGQVINQLLSNAFTHCPEGTTVRVWLDRAGSEAIIGVEDDGPGILPEIREILFRPFGKPRVNPDPKRYGAGVGLAIARRIVEGHDGRIEVATEAGKGSCFRIALPLATAQTA